MLNIRRSLIFMIGLFLFFTSAISAETLSLANTNDELLKAFDQMLDDPYFERFTGLKIIAKDSYTLDNAEKVLGGTQSFTFTRTVRTTTVKTNVDKTTTTLASGREVEKTTTTRETSTQQGSDELNVAYLPTLTLPNKEGGMRNIELDCDFGDLGQRPEAGASFGQILGAMMTGIGKGMVQGLSGGSEFSDSKTTWSPFNPEAYANWLRSDWMVWRFKMFLAGEEDSLDKGMTLYGEGNYEEALPIFEKLADNFPISKKRN
ncbi:MAG: hypothetical protein WC838_07210, partial [Candidatus Margulisiibacteriota bacterium]